MALYTGDSTYLHEGLIEYPIRFGHEWSGTVEQVGAGVVGFASGDRVAGHNFAFCGSCERCRAGLPWLCPNRSEAGVRGPRPGAAAELVAMPAASMVTLPESLSLRDAACLEPVTCAMHGLARAGVREDDRVVVIGTGMLGLAAIQIASEVAAEVAAVGIDSDGLGLARELGAEHAFTPDAAPCDSYSLVVEASGAELAVALAPSLAAPGARVALVGVAHRSVDRFPASEVVLKDLSVLGAIGGLDQWQRVLGLVERKQLDLAALVEAELPYWRAEEAFRRLAAPRRRPKLLLAFGEPEPPT
jgi:threonine dehydrogenase-like Zn-dependent dehydrogenase